MSDDNAFYIGLGTVAAALLGGLAYAASKRSTPRTTRRRVSEVIRPEELAQVADGTGRKFGYEGAMLFTFQEGFRAAVAEHSDKNPYSAPDYSFVGAWAAGYEAGTHFVEYFEALADEKVRQGHKLR